MATSFCKICGKEKNISEFRKGGEYKGRAYYYHCKPCFYEKRKQYARSKSSLENEARRKREYHQRHKGSKKSIEKIRKYQTKACKLIKNNYVKKLIRDSLGVRTENITEGLVELKREQITIKRLLEDLKNGPT